MSFSDQKFLEKILSLMKEKINLKVAIIHNFYGLENIKDVENCIENQILKGPFKVDEFIINKENQQKVFIHKENNSIFHCIIANNNSEAGNYYNRNTFNFLKQTIVYLNNIEFVDIEQEFIGFLEVNKMLYYYDSNCIE